MPCASSTYDILSLSANRAQFGTIIISFKTATLGGNTVLGFSFSKNPLYVFRLNKIDFSPTNVETPCKEKTYYIFSRRKLQRMGTWY